MSDYRVIIPNSADPTKTEINVARIISNYYESNVEFIVRKDYKTADIRIIRQNLIFEIKSPRGNSKKTIENNLRTAQKQSNNIVIDLSRTKMTTAQAVSRASFFLSHAHPRIKILLVISKQNKVLKIK